MPSKKVTRRASRSAAAKVPREAAPAPDRTLSAEHQTQLRQDRTLRAIRDERARQAVLEKQGYCF